MNLTFENYCILISILLITVLLASVITYWDAEEEPPKQVSRPEALGKKNTSEREHYARSQVTNGQFETFYERASDVEKKIIHSIIARLNHGEYPDNFYHSVRNKTPEGKILYSLSYIRIAAGFKKSYYYYCHFVNPCAKYS